MKTPEEVKALLPAEPMTEPKEVLLKVAGIFEDYPEMFAHGELALDGEKKPVAPLSPDGVCFCTLGLISRLSGVDFDADVDGEELERFLNPLRLEIFQLYGTGTGIAEINDEIAEAMPSNMSGRQAIIAACRSAVAKLP